MIINWKVQKKIILHRLRTILIYELDKDLLYTKLKKADFDIDTRLLNVEYLFSGYLDNIFKLMKRDQEENPNDKPARNTKLKDKK